MCGVAGFTGRAPDPFVLALASRAAGQRGPHSHGWWWRDLDGGHLTLGPGPLHDPPRISAHTCVVLAHSRLATSGARAGERPDPDEGQPLVCGEVVIAHNGVVPTARTAVDSATLLAAIADELLAGTGAVAAIQTTLDRLCPGPTVLLAAVGLTLVAARSPGAPGSLLPAHPLYVYARREGTYLSSRPFADAAPLEEGTHVIG